jgi:hypothetical protein
MQFLEMGSKSLSFDILEFYRKILERISEISQSEYADFRCITNKSVSLKILAFHFSIKPNQVDFCNFFKKFIEMFSSKILSEHQNFQTFNLQIFELRLLSPYQDGVWLIFCIFSKVFQ